MRLTNNDYITRNRICDIKVNYSFNNPCQYNKNHLIICPQYDNHTHTCLLNPGIPRPAITIIKRKTLENLIRYDE